jgi:hypothetical protein
MSELGYYQYGVLSQMGEGPMPSQKELQWYEFIWDWDVVPRDFDGIVIPAYRGATKISKPEIYNEMLFGGL